jgi:type II restriction/modification system DNA methylase subunit YeeA
MDGLTQTFPWWNGDDLVGRIRDYWIINFGEKSLAESAFYEKPFSYIERIVHPVRGKSRSDLERNNWWKLARRAPAMFAAAQSLNNFLVTPETSKHRIFSWCPCGVIPDKNLVVIAKDDDTTFGIVHSRFHSAWALRLGTSLEDRPRYTSSTTFRTFPFPNGLTPERPAAEYADDSRAIAIAELARRLNELREAWLNPPDLVERVPEVVPGYPDRVVPVSPKAAAILKARTSTKLYNERPTWLDNAHRELDAAVAAAYGWPADIAEEEALSRLLALNLERAALGR